MDDEKIITAVVEEVLGHPEDREDYNDNLYSDYYNNLGDNKPKYNDPQMQRMQ